VIVYNIINNANYYYETSIRILRNAPTFVGLKSLSHWHTTKYKQKSYL